MLTETTEIPQEAEINLHLTFPFCVYQHLIKDITIINVCKNVRRCSWTSSTKFTINYFTLNTS